MPTRLCLEVHAQNEEELIDSKLFYREQRCNQLALRRHLTKCITFVFFLKSASPPQTHNINQ